MTVVLEETWQLSHGWGGGGGPLAVLPQVNWRHVLSLLIVSWILIGSFMISCHHCHPVFIRYKIHYIPRGDKSLITRDIKWWMTKIFYAINNMFTLLLIFPKRVRQLWVAIMTWEVRENFNFTYYPRGEKKKKDSRHSYQIQLAAVKVLEAWAVVLWQSSSFSTRHKNIPSVPLTPQIKYSTNITHKQTNEDLQNKVVPSSR